MLSTACGQEPLESHTLIWNPARELDPMRLKKKPHSSDREFLRGNAALGVEQRFEHEGELSGVDPGRAAGLRHRSVCAEEREKTGLLLRLCQFSRVYSF